MRKKFDPPGEKSAPRKSRHTKLTSKSRAAAAASAKRPGRRYPNLVDNIHAARKQRAPVGRRP